MDCRGEFWKFENQDSEATDVDIKDGDIWINRAFPDGQGAAVGPGRGERKMVINLIVRVKSEAVVGSKDRESKVKF